MHYFRAHTLVPGRLVRIIALVSWAFVASAGRAQSPKDGTTKFLMTLYEAEAKTSANEWSAAAALWEQILAMNPVNGAYWNRLAIARYNAKDYRSALLAFKKVMELRDCCFPAAAAYQIARCFAQLNDKENALLWLGKAFRMGYRHVDDMKTDAALQGLRPDPRFRELVGLVDTDKMSRTEGWRYDLSFFNRELNRRGYDPFHNISRETFDESLKRLSRQIPRLTDTQLVIEFTKFVASLGVGHTELELPDGYLTIPLKFYWFEEGLFAIAADPKYRDLLGAQVLQFGDRSTADVLHALDPLVSRDNDIWLKAMEPYGVRNLPILHGLGLIPESDKVVLTVRDRSGQTRSITIPGDNSEPSIWNVYPYPSTWVGFAETLSAPLPLYLKNVRPYYRFEYVQESQLVYFQYNRVLEDPDEPFERFVTRLFAFIEEHDVEKLVIDLRWNNGGNTYLLPPLMHAIIASKKINQEGKLFVVIGRRTFSAAQNAASYIQRDTEAIFVGEPTGGRPNSPGDEVYFTLPYSKLSANVSDVYWQGSWPDDFRTWIAPQIFLPPTFASYAANRDPAMEAIVNFPQDRTQQMHIIQHPGFGCN